MPGCCSSTSTHSSGISLLHRDAIVTMPPYEFWLRGSLAFAQWLQTTSPTCGHARLLPITANGSPAMAVYAMRETSQLSPSSIHVLHWRDGKVAAIHAFLEPALFGVFSLPTAPRLEATT
jgi:RNA polymerase sigma-70 factor (ECF subfamily)